MHPSSKNIKNLSENKFVFPNQAKIAQLMVMVRDDIELKKGMKLWFYVKNGQTLKMIVKPGKYILNIEIHFQKLRLQAFTVETGGLMEIYIFTIVTMTFTQLKTMEFGQYNYLCSFY